MRCLEQLQAKVERAAGKEEKAARAAEKQAAKAEAKAAARVGKAAKEVERPASQTKHSAAADVGKKSTARNSVPTRKATARRVQKKGIWRMYAQEATSTRWCAAAAG